jgi:hypothetical protein
MSLEEGPRVVQLCQVHRFAPTMKTTQESEIISCLVLYISHGAANRRTEIVKRTCIRPPTERDETCLVWAASARPSAGPDAARAGKFSLFIAFGINSKSIRIAAKSTHITLEKSRKVNRARAPTYDTVGLIAVILVHASLSVIARLPSSIPDCAPAMRYFSFRYVAAMESVMAVTFGLPNPGPPGTIKTSMSLGAVANVCDSTTTGYQDELYAFMETDMGYVATRSRSRPKGTDSYGMNRRRAAAAW